MRALGISLFVALAVQAATGSELLVRNARVVDGRGDPPRERVSMLVRDGRIAAIGAELAASVSAQVIDASGLTALPGLIDSHVHFVYASGSGYRNDSDATIRELNRQHLRAYLACGVTSVLDAGAFVETLRDIQGWLAEGHPGREAFDIAVIGFGAPWTFEFARPWLASFFLSESRLRAAIRLAQENLLRLHRAGVPLVVGTDAPSPWPDAIHHFHGVQTLEEVLLLGEAGLTPLEAIAAATSVPARMLGLDAEIGALAPGLRAEIVLVEGEPDRDLRALRRVRFTVQGGVARTPEEWMAAP